MDDRASIPGLAFDPFNGFLGPIASIQFTLPLLLPQLHMQDRGYYSKKTIRFMDHLQYYSKMTIRFMDHLEYCSLDLVFFI